MHTENCDHSNDHHHSHHSDDIAAFVFKSARPFDPARLDEFLGSLVNVFGPRMLRYKGVLLMEGADRKVVFQGVHQIMGSDIGGEMGRRRGAWQQNGVYWQKFTERCLYPRFGTMFGINYPGFRYARDGI